MEKLPLQTIIIVSENQPGVLYRISGILLRRKINVEHVEVHAINKREARFTIEIYTARETVEKLSAQIAKIIEVKETNIV